MKKVSTLLFILMFVAGASQWALASGSGYDKGSQMDEGKGSPMQAKGSHAGHPGEHSKQEVRDAISGYVAKASEETGTLNLEDPNTNSIRKLSFQHFHGGMKEKEGTYTLCVDFKDMDAGDMHDVDFDVKKIGGTLSVVDVRYHTPVKGSPKGSAMEMKGSEKESEKGSMHEHKGSHEHKGNEKKGS